MLPDIDESASDKLKRAQAESTQQLSRPFAKGGPVCKNMAAGGFVLNDPNDYDLSRSGVYNQSIRDKAAAEAELAKNQADLARANVDKVAQGNELGKKLESKQVSPSADMAKGGPVKGTGPKAAQYAKGGAVFNKEPSRFAKGR